MVAVRTLSRVTRSEAWRRVRPEMSSTRRLMVGSTAAAAGAALAAVARHLDDVLQTVSRGGGGKESVRTVETWGGRGRAGETSNGPGAGSAGNAEEHTSTHSHDEESLL